MSNTNIGWLHIGEYFDKIIKFMIEVIEISWFLFIIFSLRNRARTLEFAYLTYTNTTIINKFTILMGLRELDQSAKTAVNNLMNSIDV